MEKIATFLVEDSPVIRENLIAALEELTAVECVGCSDNEDAAVDWLAAHPRACRLVIIDIFLKGGTGLGVLEAARAMNEPMYLVVLSNYTTPDIRETCLALGADRVFDKSNQLDELMAYCESLAAH